MQDRIVIGGEVTLTNTISGDCSLTNQINGEVGVFTAVYPDSYTGEYVITPLAEQSQTLECAHLVMSQNVVVKEIPYYETHNDYGLTCYIAGSVN